MMPYCEYRKCNRVSEGTARILRMWDSFDAHHMTHHQPIWLCGKHLKKINKLLEIEPTKEGASNE